jgi:hypothetical protein
MFPLHHFEGLHHHPVMIVVGGHLGELLAHLVRVLLPQIAQEHGPIGGLEHGQPGRQEDPTIPAAVAAVGSRWGHGIFSTVLWPDRRYRW